MKAYPRIALLAIISIAATIAVVTIANDAMAQDSNAVATVSKPLTNEDIIDLAGLGLSDDVILAKIKASRSIKFDTTVEAMKTLKAAHVSDAVLKEMISGNNASDGAMPSGVAIKNTQSPARSTDSTRAIVYVYRVGKFVGRSVSPSVFVDEKKVADIDNGRFFALRLAPGTHVIRANDKDSRIDQEWEAGKVYFAKITIIPGLVKGHGQISTIGDREARREMEKLKPLDRDSIEDGATNIVLLEPLQ